MDLIHDCYNKKKLFLQFNTKDKINIILKYSLGIKDNECSITLIKKDKKLS